MKKINYQKEMKKIIENLDYKPKLLLHSCCAPCSSYVLEYLSNYFDIIIFFYNPNINIPEEFEKRYLEQKRFVEEIYGNKIQVIKGKYDPNQFLQAIKGYEKDGEGSERCTKCYELRIRESAKKALEVKADFFTTTLTISPLKNAEKLNSLGFEYEKAYGIKWLPSNFKKNNGYQNSIKLSREHDLYRQDYCGCSFSKVESLERRKKL
jgi:hypothetical protein